MPDDLPTDDEPTVRRVEGWLQRAVAERAGDLHLDLVDDGGYVRLRIDGVLHEIERLPLEAAHAALGRLKVLLDIAPGDFVMPADGRFRLDRGGRSFDVRGSYLPGADGGRICLRFLDRLSELAPWPVLFAKPSHDAAARRLMAKPCGLALICGPAGSGKTTTAYGLLQSVAGEGLNVVTVENPVEYRLPWMAQSTIGPWIGLGFLEMLRAVMRQDPDVIFLGVLPDVETARLACEAALTGHLVLATMSAPDGLAALARLRDMGLEPYHLGATLVGLMGQRLVRKVCAACRVDGPPQSAAAMMALGLDGRLDTVSHGRGCELCRGTGYRGRAPLLELIEPTAAFNDAVARDAPGEVLRELAFTPDLPDFRGMAAELVSAGVTTPEEALRVLQGVL